MKTPRFEELAVAWKGRAQLFFVFSKEPHANGAMGERLNKQADTIEQMDADRDGKITLAEFKGMPRWVFDSYDIDHDGVITSYEFLTVRRIDGFKDWAAPATREERVKAAGEYRKQVPGKIPVLIDELDNHVSLAYGGLPNSSFVVGKDGKVVQKLAWASPGQVQEALAQATGSPPPAHVAKKPVDLQPVSQALAAAKKGKKPLLVEFTAIGCKACQAMEPTLAEPDVKAALGRYEVARLGVDKDDAWGLFEALDLASTPALVVLAPDGKVKARAQGLLDKAKLLTFLQEGRR